MTRSMLLLYFCYLPAFALAQQIVARRSGAQNIARSQRYLRIELLESAIRAIAFMLPFGYFASFDGFSDSVAFPFLRAAGVLVVVLGIIVSMWAQRALGKHWVGGAALRQSHELIQGGPYKYVRHPLYSGMWISAIGQSLIALDPWLAATALVFVGSYAIRAPFEDYLLMTKFKRKWERYADSTGMFLPKFGRRNG